MAVNIGALASQAAAQGQQMLNNDNNNAAQYKSQYDNLSGQASAANNAVNDYTKGMQGSYDAKTGNGNAGSTYNYGLDSQLGKVGYSQDQMTAASNNLNQSTGAMSAYNDFANTAASKFGMNAGGFAAANAGALGSINNNIASNQGVVNQLMDKYKTAQTGANQFTGQVIQGQHETLGGLNANFANIANQRDSAGSMMNFYSKLASDQGGLNAQQQASYGAAQQAYSSAQAAIAQAGLYGSQSAQIRQQMGFDANSASQANSNAQYAAMQAKPAPFTPNSKPQPAAAWYSPSNIASELTNVYHGAQQAGGFSNDVRNVIGRYL
jgi:hypothetical protein